MKGKTKPEPPEGDFLNLLNFFGIFVCQLDLEMAESEGFGFRLLLPAKQNKNYAYLSIISIT